ncbi:potassium channel family protein [Mycoplasmopsis pulmonis]|uniref:potassium channel family protein n=1 Tax=Mycoplasmopsis pulmonis TaxID=2107 RepID=UPI002ACF01CC|nr:potassium channel family protein [Mycoplasmopsis pulmonis]MDZ7293706.1 potassium channel family protein [Mycoplasmopsis pulmonis]
MNQKYLNIAKHLNNVAINEKSKEKDQPKVNLIVDVLRKIWFIVVLSFIILSFLLLIIDKKFIASNKSFFLVIELTIFFVLLVDFFLWTFTYPYRKNGKLISMIIFPFTFTGILLVSSFVPSIWILEAFIENKDINVELQNNKVPKTFEISQVLSFLRSLVFLRVGRVLMLLQVFEPFKILYRAFKNEKKILISLFVFIIILILIFSLIIYSVETIGENANPNIKNYWDAIYFTTISMTTIGYGDISPVTTNGKIIIVIISIIGIALFAIPSGVIAGAFLAEIQKKINNPNNNEEENFFKKLNPLEKVKFIFFCQDDSKKQKQKEAIVNDKNNPKAKNK